MVRVRVRVRVKVRVRGACARGGLAPALPTEARARAVHVMYRAQAKLHA